MQRQSPHHNAARKRRRRRRRRQDAVLHGRLASDTYKRLALCLGYVALLLGVALLRFHSVVPAASLA